MFFGMMNLIFPIFFILVLSMVIFTFTKGIGEWNKNNHSPRLTVEATVVTKRTQIHHHHNGENGALSHTDTSYYVTFEVESGDRMELSVNGRSYGMLVEGDQGYLSFQGTRYLDFERKK